MRRPSRKQYGGLGLLKHLGYQVNPFLARSGLQFVFGDQMRGFVSEGLANRVKDWRQKFGGVDAAWDHLMLIEKLAAGVVRLQTPMGPRYVMPSFLQRIYVLWMFRNFAILPYAVLSGRQQRLIDRMCSEQRFDSIAYVNGLGEAPVIGTIERRPINESLPSRHAVARETGTLAA